MRDCFKCPITNPSYTDCRECRKEYFLKYSKRGGERVNDTTNKSRNIKKS